MSNEVSVKNVLCLRNGSIVTDTIFMPLLYDNNVTGTGLFALVIVTILTK